MQKEEPYNHLLGILQAKGHKLTTKQWYDITLLSLLGKAAGALKMGRGEVLMLQTFVHSGAPSYEKEHI